MSENEKTRLTELKDELKDISKDLCDSVLSARRANDNVRFCRWDGQSTDGRKHAESMGELARPFEGASDSRIRLADDLVNYRVALLTAAATRTSARIVGMETTDEAGAARMTTLLRWVIRNQLGMKYRREIKKLAQFQQGDSPAIGFLGIYWDQQFALESQTLTSDVLAQMIYAAFGQAMTADDKIRFGNMFTEESMEDDAVATLQTLIEGLREDEARKVAREIRKDGVSTFGREYLRVNIPRLVAHRLYEDIFIPSDTVDMDTCRCYFVREWLTEEQLRGRIITDGYSEDVVLKMIGSEEEPGCIGDSILDDYEKENISELLTDGTTEDHSSEYEVITAYSRQSKNNVTGIYRMVFSGKHDTELKEEELLNYAHGRYPVVPFPREILNNCLLDSRGIPELVMSEQQSIKLLNDSFEDYTQISTIPPIKRIGPRARTRLLMGPMVEVPVKRKDDADWMKPPPYPIGNDKHRDSVEARVAAYFGKPHPQVPQDVTMVVVQDMIEDFLVPLKEALTMLVQLCQQFMTDEEIMRVTGGKGMPGARSRQEIQGKFDMELSFDARDLNLEYLLQKLKVIREMILPMDVQGTIGRAAVVARMMQAIDPALADEAIVSGQEANQREVDDEELNFTKIAAGIEPAMMPEGQNHALRLQVLLGIAQKNPEAVQKLSETSQQILKKRMDHLQFQTQQAQNAMIGRVGALPALGGGMQ